MRERERRRRCVNYLIKVQTAELDKAFAEMRLRSVIATTRSQPLGKVTTSLRQHDSAALRQTQEHNNTQLFQERNGFLRYWNIV